MTEKSTSADLLERLSAAAKKSLTEAEIRAQRVSFIMSAVDDDSTITRAQIEQIINENEGQSAA